MADHYLVDTNLILRLVVGSDPPEPAEAARAFFEDIATSGAPSAVLTSLVVGECVYVLTSHYGLRRGDVSEAMRKVMDLPGVRVPHRRTLERTFELFRQRPKLHFVDCFLLAEAEQNDQGVATLDAGLAKAGLVPTLNPLRQSARRKPKP
ncbi:MAG: PIN domain-containing protein [Planctomycetota bacterium]